MFQAFKIFLKAAFRKKSISFYLSLCVLAIIISTSSVINIKDIISTRVESNLQKYKRPLYDILVRPKDTMSPLEKKYGIVEGNFIQETKNKISVKEYEKIKNIKGVQIAAPVAPLGYVPNNYVDIVVCFPFTPSEIFIQNEESIITDGIRKFLNHSTKYLATPETAQIINFHGNTYMTGGGLLPFTTFFVVGIDPYQENNLCRVRKALIKGKFLDKEKPFYLSFSGDDQTTPDVLLVPAMVASSAYNNCYAEITQKKYDKSVLYRTGAANIPAEDIKRDISIWRLLQNVKPKEEEKLRLSVKNITPFLRTSFIYIENKLLKVDLSFLYESPPYTVKGKLLVRPLKEGDEIKPEFGYGAGEISSQRIIITHPANYKPTSNVKAWKGLELTAVPIGKRNDDPLFVAKAIFGPYPLFLDEITMDDAPVYRETTVVRSFVFQIVPIGKIDLEKVAASHQTLENWVPLGMYLPPKTKLMFDVRGNPVPETEVYPVDDPRMLLLNSPLCFVDWRAVAKLRGEKCITAIRIKCVSEDRIDDVVREIKKIGNYDINVVYGSSPQKVLVGDLNFKGAKGLGYFVQLWTTLGANMKIRSIHQKFKLLLLLLNLAVLVSLSAIYTMFYLAGLATERKYMEKIGHTKIYKTMLFAAFSILPIGACIALIALLSVYFAQLSKTISSFEFFRNLIGYFSIFILLSWTMVLFVENIKSGAFKKDFLKMLKIRNVLLAAIKSELSSPSLMLAQMTLFGISQATIVLTVTSIYSIIKNYNLFILGERILKENLSNYILLLISSITMIVIASIASVVIRTKRYEREAGFLKAIGWKRNEITKYITSIEFIVMVFGLAIAFIAFSLILKSSIAKDLLLIVITVASGFLLPALIHFLALIRIIKRIDAVKPFKGFGY